tara:strand:- start:1246 stop:2151 length:906 start_codon:yes stop_codon:yes gene_type:complete
MILDHNEQFKKKGYVLIDNYLSKENLNFFLAESTKVLDKSYKAEWPFLSVYNDYPHFKGKINLFGVNFPLNDFFNTNLLECFNAVHYSKHIINLTGWKHFRTSLIRLHAFDNFYNYYGAWHRDDEVYPSPSSIQSVLYMKDEKGFRIIPKHNVKLLSNYNIKISGESTNKSYTGKELPKFMYDTIKAKKGDLLFFESGLLHQGFCKSERLHFHLRHINALNETDFDSKNLMNFNKEFLPKYEIQKIEEIFPKFNVERKFVGSFKRALRFVQYFFPRIKILLENLFGKEKLKQNPLKNTIWQ